MTKVKKKILNEHVNRIMNKRGNKKKEKHET